VHVVATAGHVDHGKSTLVRALTGMEPDRWAEERRRGMTIDLGFAWTALPARPDGPASASGPTVAFVDVPGHERFVTTMLAGVGPVPAVLMVVAADEGWMPQSAEHLDACSALGVRDGLLVITRSDLLEPEPALADAREHLAGTPLADLPAVCVSAVTGTGLDELRTALAALADRLPRPDPAADVRLWVDRAFTIRGAGTVVTGTLGAGRLRVDDELRLLTPDGERPVRVRGLQRLGEQATEVTGVARVALNLRGLPREAVARGDVLLAPAAWLTADTVDVRLHGVRQRGPDPAGVDPAGLPERMSMHIGAAAIPVRIRPLGPDTARLRLARPLPLRIGDRAVLRDPGRHMVTAGLTVLDVRPPPLRRRGAAAARGIELTGMLGQPDAVAELARRGLVRGADLIAMGVPAHALAAPAVAAASTATGWLLDPARARQLGAELAAAVAAHDTADPLDPGLPIEAARRAIGLPEPRLVEAVLRFAESHATAGGPAPELVLRHGRVVRAAAAERLPAALRAAMDQLRADLLRDPFGAPDAGRLAALGLGPRQLGSLVKAGELMRIADGVVLLPGADERALAVLAALEPVFTLSAARQALGTSRRVAVPLLELLARDGRTIRTPDGGHRLA
jgi:selenocysteine-specific elongation factor